MEHSMETGPTEGYMVGIIVSILFSIIPINPYIIPI